MKTYMKAKKTNKQKKRADFDFKKSNDLQHDQDLEGKKKKSNSVLFSSSTLLIESAYKLAACYNM